MIRSRVHPRTGASVAAFRRSLAGDGYEYTPAEAEALLVAVNRAGSITSVGPGECCGCRLICREVITVGGGAGYCPDCWLPRKMERAAAGPKAQSPKPKAEGQP